MKFNYLTKYVNELCYEYYFNRQTKKKKAFILSHYTRIQNTTICRENKKKMTQLNEAQVDSSTLRALQFHQSQIYDPEFTEKELQMRDVYPDYYLHPNDEFVYQTVRGRAREEKGIINYFFFGKLRIKKKTVLCFAWQNIVKEQLHAEAVAFLKEWQKLEEGNAKKGGK
ncbi:hypothetical protein RFI_32235 [Reticulomyxa filosa]|uniref:Uncharacterized protein n=1 Tax=Reticulomyxa filosa TaxID=46433 RepID=X6LUU1_RETFI|nr:hypothetical protein RFI_32235 [Reticulomyxa filosa]|eukprot:ETO05161.1 hypothetical protein RFI_32235 [Reticulomyxa filosa]